MCYFMFLYFSFNILVFWYDSILNRILICLGSMLMCMYCTIFFKKFNTFVTDSGSKNCIYENKNRKRVV